MSADNGIFILELVNGKNKIYKVKEDTESCLGNWYEDYKYSQNPETKAEALKMVLEIYKDCEIFQDVNMAREKAFEIEAKLDICEYGVMQISVEI